MYMEEFTEIGKVPKFDTCLGKVPSHVTGTWHCAKSCDQFWQLAKKVT